MEHNVKSLLEVTPRPFRQVQVKCLMLQLLNIMKDIHQYGVVLGNMKTSHLLCNCRGELRICDFKMAELSGHILKRDSPLPLPLIYTPPELLLRSNDYKYSTALDMWSLGCIMAELLMKEPLFERRTETEQLHGIFEVLGAPNETILPGFTNWCNSTIVSSKESVPDRLKEKLFSSPFSRDVALSNNGFDLLNKFLTYDPRKRITAEDALKHKWFLFLAKLAPNLLDTHSLHGLRSSSRRGVAACIILC